MSPQQHYSPMSTLKELLPNQHIKIDNHASGKEMRWDWDPGQRPDDIHLDKMMDEKVEGMEVHVRVSLNHDGGVTEPKKRERKNNPWMKEYNRVKSEVHRVLSENSDLLKEFIESVNQQIHQIGPHKEPRAVRKALERIGKFFDLSPNVIDQMERVRKGFCCLFLQDEVPMYIGFGNDYAFHLGTGGHNTFIQHVQTTKTWDEIIEKTGHYPTLQDLLNRYQKKSKSCTKGMIEELEIARKTYNNPQASIEDKARVLLVPQVRSYRIHQWRLLTKHEALAKAIEQLTNLIQQNKYYETFEVVFADIETALEDVKHIAGLTYYDVAKRLWYALGHDELQTQEVYLYSGAYKGAHSILQSALGRKLQNKEPLALFPPELQKMDSLYLEDFLCVMHKELAIMYNDIKETRY